MVLQIDVSGGKRNFVKTFLVVLSSCMIPDLISNKTVSEFYLTSEGVPGIHSPQLSSTRERLEEQKKF